MDIIHKFVFDMPLLKLIRSHVLHPLIEERSRGKEMQRHEVKL